MKEKPGQDYDAVIVAVEKALNFLSGRNFIFDNKYSHGPSFKSSRGNLMKTSP